MPAENGYKLWLRYAPPGDAVVAYRRAIRQVVVEGTSFGTTASNAKWRAGVTHAGRWCDVFEIRDFLIQRVFIYLDPDYAGEDTARYPWLAQREPTSDLVRT